MKQRQTNLFEFIEDKLEAAKQELHRLAEEAKAKEAADTKVTTNFSDLEVIDKNINEVLMLTLQAGPVKKETAETLRILTEIKYMLRSM